MLIITDGSPDDPTATRAATARVKAEGIEVAAIGIHTDAVKQLWKQHCVINLVQELPQALFGVLEAMLLGRPLSRVE